MTELDRDSLTFLEAEGLAPLPQQLELRTITRHTRALLWQVVDHLLKETSEIGAHTEYQWVVGFDWKMITYRWHVEHEHLPSDEHRNLFSFQHDALKNIIWNKGYADVYELITFILRSPTCPASFPTRISKALEDSRAAYRIRGKTVFPMASEAEAALLDRAFDSLEAPCFSGSRSHLEAAGGLLSEGDFAGSIREAIHAVESVGKVVEPKAGTLSDVLKRLDSSGRINPNLKRALNALYDYSSDEQGIRHARVFGPEASVDEADALFMLGACAAFITYLTIRAAPAGS
jgi:hypothetical protein